jgi:hypothetical protein
MLGYDSGQIEAALENELIIEVCCHEKKVP